MQQPQGGAIPEFVHKTIIVQVEGEMVIVDLLDCIMYDCIMYEDVMLILTQCQGFICLFLFADVVQVNNGEL